MQMLHWSIVATSLPSPVVTSKQMDGQFFTKLPVISVWPQVCEQGVLVCSSVTALGCCVSVHRTPPGLTAGADLVHIWEKIPQDTVRFIRSPDVVRHEHIRSVQTTE